MSFWRQAAAVFAKEWVDALRDRRTLLTVLLSSVAIGPAVLVVLSLLVAGQEQRAEQRELVLAGAAQAPTLVNHLERQTWRVREAPPDWPAQLRDKRLGEPVLVVPADFEAALQRGDMPVLEVFSSSANPRAERGVARVERLLQGFAQEQVTLRLVHRGVAPALLQPVQVQPRDVADPAARSAQLMSLIPFFVLIAVLYGALNAALDTTAGERERGSLEPLLMNPVSRAALVAGKWGAVAAVAVLIAALGAFSFLPGQWLLKSETLSAMFRFGAGEALAFVLIALPLAGALSALLMAIAIRCKSFKEAQANATVLVLAMSMLPLLSLFQQEGDTAWQWWLPGLAQSALMGRVLKGEPLLWAQWLPATAVCGVLAAVALAYVARVLGRAALDR